MLTGKLERIVFYLLLFFLPTQLGKHFWPDFSIVSGVRVDYLSPTLYVTDILVVLLFITWMVRRSYRLEFKMQSFKPVLFLLAFLLLNIYFSQNYLNGFYHLLKFLELSFVAYYVATMVKNTIQIKKMFLVLGIGVIFQSFLAISQFIKQESLGGMFYFFGERLFNASTPGIANASINGELLLRPYGTFSHPNVLAGFLLLSMIGLLFTLPWTRNLERVVWISALLFGSSALLLTMSRTAFLLWIILLIVVFLRQFVVSPTRSFIAVLFVTLSILCIGQTPFGSRLLQTNFAEEAVVQRTELLQASATMVAQQPVIGIGFGNFIPQLATVQQPLSVGFYLQPVHNVFLLVLVETGIFGLSFFIWFLFKTYRRLFQLAKKTRVLPYRIFVVLLSVVLVVGLFDHYFFTLQQGQLLFALIIGLCWTSIKS